ncbi:DUF2254 domain-containing protein [Auraticoccus monumenti]|uniref:Uncharacterized membrane protein n=1 Tax=Auraticoccus monumenti TaxID=675864 RepID=A0A1G6WGC4_9ACTN|nr:DUF2254 domain-containing protein [Auraticoccus monumenti]SDD64839.1 Uncharacterized membrane protein [Auraticoccus monumenti]
MRTLRHRALGAVDSFWFLPALLVAAALVLAELVVTLDRSFSRELSDLPFISGMGASGSRDLLAAVGGSMLGVAATAFSITISVIATASSTYGPRLVRNFMADRGNQVVLGVFGATFIYTLMVLRTVRAEEGDTFVPHLAVTLAIGLAVVDVAVLVYFIHHIADSIQVPTLVSQVLGDLQRCSVGEDPRPSRQVEQLPGGAPTTTVRAEHHGFLRHVDRASLVTMAERRDALVQLLPAVGDHVIAGDALAHVWARGDGEEVQDLEQGVRRHLTFGPSRTPDQDLRYAARQLVEMAVRALSPSTNDPYTATNAVLELGTGLAPRLASEDVANGYEQGGELRLVDSPVPAVELVRGVFDQLRPHAASSPEMVLALLDLKRVLATGTERGDVLAELHRQEAVLRRAFAATGPDPYDRERVEQHRTR